MTTVNKSMIGIQVKHVRTAAKFLSQVNTIGCANEGLWIFSLEDSKKRRYTVNWEDQSRPNLTEKWKTEEHEWMIDSGCFGQICPPCFAPQFPLVSSTNVDAVAAHNVALQHYGQKVANFDPDHI